MLGLAHGPSLGAYVAAPVSLRLCATLPLAYCPASVFALRILAAAASSDVFEGLRIRHHANNPPAFKEWLCAST